MCSSNKRVHIYWGFKYICCLYVLALIILFEKTHCDKYLSENSVK